MRRSVSMVISAAVCSKIPPVSASVGPLLSASPVLYNPKRGIWGMARRDMGVGDRGEKSPGSLNCADVIGLFPEYFSGSLSPFQSVLFEEHRAACASCRSELAIRARETMRTRLDPTRRGQTMAPVGARLRNVLFHPARVKVPLEAAGLLIALGLALYVS